ncbi:hypothetical protein HNR77_002540 [Paenibacillus sp. JGP012]|uniref:discoidin domain-containing protein n=1 Tax=Paenibacillus sp. JGP012 TaxID=2735914 RepID=UPI00160FFB52|nr:discoidin domain-containing protein [Paenibacillus sp. JGP012]MBB6021445.1 hypothetical protein [Paenibacillus sp. JGP012]
MKKYLYFLLMFLMIGVLSLKFNVSISHAEETFSENLIPIMTSATSPSGKATSSEQWQGTNDWKAFDGVEQYSTSPGIYTAWGTTKTTGWLAYEFPNPKKVAKYVIGYGGFVGTSEFGSQPKDWTFEGSDDGLEWHILDTQKNVTSWIKNTSKTYIIENNKAYKFYRINVTANNGSSSQVVNLTIHELKMMERTASIPNESINLIASAGDSKVVLNWNYSNDSNNESYTISRADSNGGPYTVISSNTKGSSFTDNNVINGKTYYYIVSQTGTNLVSNEANATPQKVITPDPEPSGNRAILNVIMTTGLEKEYDLPMTDINAFLNWYDARDIGTGPAKFAINKYNNNKGPFSKRTEYVIFDKILTFEVSEYTAN